MELKIDDLVVEAQKGELLLQVALRNGIEIPHFCYHPCLSIAGNCRICLVKVEGQPKLAPSCNLTVTPDMKVTTDCSEVRAAREAVMQFIMAEHPGDCGICDKAGECRLQDYQVKYGEIEPLVIEKHPYSAVVASALPMRCPNQSSSALSSVVMNHRSSASRASLSMIFIRTTSSIFARSGHSFPGIFFTRAASGISSRCARCVRVVPVAVASTSGGVKKTGRFMALMMS